MSLDPLRRRALINGGIAAGVTLVLGLGLVAGLTASEEEPPPSPTPITSPTPPPPACTPLWELTQGADPGELSNWLFGVTALSAGEAWAVGGPAIRRGPSRC